MESRKVGENTKFTQESQTKGVDLKLGEEPREKEKRKKERQWFSKYVGIEHKTDSKKLVDWWIKFENLKCDENLNLSYFLFY